MFKYRLSWLAACWFLLFQGCANIVPPEGGPKDTTPPVLLSVSPQDSSLNVKVKKIELRFNKFMEVREPEKHFQISPFLRINPMLLSYGKRVVVTIADTLLEDATTYRIQFGDALVDNRENTPFSGYEYIFSTGAYFDSLTLAGQVIDAESGLVDSGFVVVLYPEGTLDSAIFREKPLYATPVDAQGYFEFTHLPARNFRIFALQDGDNNYTYMPGIEKIDFHDTLVRPGETEDLLFFPFREEIGLDSTDSDEADKDADQSTDSDELVNDVDRDAGKDDAAVETAETADSETDSESGKERRGFNRSGSRKTGRTPAQPYRVLVDTTRLTTGTFDITGPLNILIADTLLVDTQLVYLSFDDEGIEVEAPFRFERDSTRIRLFAEWQSDKVYTLRLVKGWARDTSGAEQLPGKYFFRTRSEKDYGNLHISLDTSLLGDQYILQVARDTTVIYEEVVEATQVQLELLEPGEYRFKIIIDENRNGKWDTGDFLKRRHAEKVWPASARAIVRAGWDNRFDFEVLQTPARAEKSSRFDPGAAEPEPAAELQPDKPNVPDHRE